MPRAPAKTTSPRDKRAATDAVGPRRANAPGASGKAAAKRHAPGAEATNKRAARKGVVAAVGTPRSTKRSAVEKGAAARPRARTPARAKPRAGAAPRRPKAVDDPLGRSIRLLDDAENRPSARGDREPEAAGRVMELQWDDGPPAPPPPEALVTRWVKRGDTLLRHLAEHGAARHEYRADLKDGRFVWVDPEGRVSAEATARVLCSWSQTTSAVVMAWADPLVRTASVGRIDAMPSERDDVDEETAWRVAMEAAEATRAEYLYRVTTPDAWYFLSLSQLSFSPGRASFRPSTPVGLVLRSVSETRQAIESRAEPTDVVRERLSSVGRALAHEADYAYRGTDWVARLARAGRRLVNLAERLPRQSYKSIAAGRQVDEFLGREATIELSEALAMLEDEWALFA